MEVEIKTTSLKEIIKKCEALGWDIKDVKISHKICEDITKPDDYFVRMYLKNTKLHKSK